MKCLQHIWIKWVTLRFQILFPMETHDKMQKIQYIVTDQTDLCVTITQEPNVGIKPRVINQIK